MSGIANQFARLSFQFRRDTAVEGMPIEGIRPQGRPFTNPRRREVWELTFGGTPTDGVYSATLLGLDGSRLTQTVTRVAGVPATNTDLAAQWASDLFANPARKGLVLETSDDTGVASVRFKHMRAYELVELSAPNPGTLAAEEIISWEGVPLPVGRFVIIGELEGLAAVILPQDATTAAEIYGVTLRPHAGIARPRGAGEGVGAGGVPEYGAGQPVSAVHQCIFAARNYGSVAAAPNGQVHVVRNTAGSQERGQPRADADGGNTVALDLSRARWLDVTEPGELGPLYVNM